MKAPDRVAPNTGSLSGGAEQPCAGLCLSSTRMRMNAVGQFQQNRSHQGASAWYRNPAVDRLIRDRTHAIGWRAISRLAMAQQRHKIIHNRVALVGEESVSGVTGGSVPLVQPRENPPMRTYVIGHYGIALCRETPVTGSNGEIVVTSKEELPRRCCGGILLRPSLTVAAV